MRPPAGETMSRAAKKLVRLQSRNARPRRLRRLAARTQRLIDNYQKRLLVYHAWCKASGFDVWMKWVRA